MWKLNKNVNKALVLSKHTAVITVLTILLLFLSAGHPFTIFWVLVGYFSLLHRLDGTFCSSLGSVYAIRGTKPRLGQSHLLSLESEAQEARDTRIPTSLSIPAAWTSPQPTLHTPSCSDPCLSEVGLFGCWLDSLRCPRSFQYILSLPVVTKGWFRSFSIRGHQYQLDVHKREGK